MFGILGEEKQPVETCVVKIIGCWCCRAPEYEYELSFTHLYTGRRA